METWIKVRCSSSEKEQWVRAYGEGNLSENVRTIVNKDAKRKLDKREKLAA